MQRCTGREACEKIGGRSAGNWKLEQCGDTGSVDCDILTTSTEAGREPARTHSHSLVDSDRNTNTNHGALRLTNHEERILNDKERTGV